MYEQKETNTSPREAAIRAQKDQGLCMTRGERERIFAFYTNDLAVERLLYIPTVDLDGVGYLTDLRRIHDPGLDGSSLAIQSLG